MLHDLAAVEVGTQRVELLFVAELGDARFEGVHAFGQHAGLGLVAGGAVGAGERVQALEQRPRIAGVAAHGAVGPVVAVAVEPEVQLDEPADGDDVVV